MGSRKFFSKLLVIAFILVTIGFFYYNRATKVNAVVIDKSVIDLGIGYLDDLPNIKQLQTDYDNPEIMGVLNIPDTDVQVIVTQGTDNKKYLTTNIYGEKDIIGNPFMDYRTHIKESPKILIYGHNSNIYELPFRELENYYNKDFYDSHPYVELITEQGLWRYKIFSVYVETNDWYYMKLDFEDEDDWLQHLEKLKTNSMYDTGEEISPGDQILILQTCSFKKEYQDYNKKYLLIIARRVY